MTSTQELQYHTQEVVDAFENGWQWLPDHTHPHNQSIGYYSRYTNEKAYGWYIKPDHPQKSVRIGDSRPMWMAAKTVATTWS